MMPIHTLGRLVDGVDGRLGAVLADAPRLIEDGERRSRRLVAGSLERMARAAARHDGGAALLARVGTAARAQLQRRELALDTAWDGVVRETEARLRQADADLARYE